MKKFEYHNLANLFPFMSPGEFQLLCDDISKNGLLNPIILFEGKILDGRNRHRACSSLGIEPTYKEFNGTDPFSFVVSQNLHRRHLSNSQRACLALRFEELFASEAKARQIEGGKRKVRQSFDDPNNRRSAQKAAVLFRTNRTYITMAKKIQKLNLVMFQQIEAGEISLFEANKKVVREQVREVPNLTGEYGVILCDPPWKYSGFILNPVLEPEYHYETMTHSDLKAMKEQIESVSAENSVIFMWATPAKLQEALELLGHWGFTYKTNLVWEKGRGMLGAWAYNKHEFILIGTRGSVAPSTTLHTSVLKWKRTNHGNKHSGKPDALHHQIEKWFPKLSKLELFARNTRPGWFSFGNQLDTKIRTK